jgi:cholesterol transport system auxiliary component
MLDAMRSFWKAAALGCCGIAFAGCALLGSRGAAPPSLFSLELPRTQAAAHDVAAAAIEVAPPTARAGFDGSRMAYVTRPYELQFFAHHQWVEPPVRMLAPLLAEAIERDASLRASASGDGAAAALRLETEIVVLQQEFAAPPSVVRFRLDARLVDPASRRVLAASAFEAVETAPSEDPYGGVIAANRAVARVLDEVAAWCGRNAAPEDRAAATSGRAR